MVGGAAESAMGPTLVHSSAVVLANVMLLIRNLRV
jgi:hypothetical protein